MKRLIILSTLMVLDLHLAAQNTLDHILKEVEKNNTTLSAHRLIADAEKIGNKTGIAPQNPEIEFNYLWGSPSEIGNRTDISVIQSFDFPTTYAYKNQISDIKNEQTELEFKKRRNEVLYQATVVCVNLTYYNALNAELIKRKTNAQQVADACNSRYSAGDASIIEYNKAQVNILNITKELERKHIERDVLISELILLNGGNSIVFTDSLFPVHTIPVDFEQWYTLAEEHNPLLKWVKQNSAIAEKQSKLNAAMSLPKFYGGYMSENVPGQQFRGVTIGMTLPLWENRHTVEYARVRTLAMQSLEDDARLQFYNSMKATHARVLALQKNVNEYRVKLSLFSNNSLLEKAFSRGEISLAEYIYEISLYYEGVDQLLEMELDLNLAIAELKRYE